ncbi:hypothetical protein GQ53DRAFT_812666, partial [Thozetella sp. PMI_491]
MSASAGRALWVAHPCWSTLDLRHARLPPCSVRPRSVPLTTTYMRICRARRSAEGASNRDSEVEVEGCILRAGGREHGLVTCGPFLNPVPSARPSEDRAKVSALEQ